MRAPRSWAAFLPHPGGHVLWDARGETSLRHDFSLPIVESVVLFTIIEFPLLSGHRGVHVSLLCGWLWTGEYAFLWQNR